jgi:hypothetical protein
MEWRRADSGRIFSTWPVHCDTVWGSIRDAYNVREAFQVIETLRRSGGRVVGEVGEMVMMVGAVAAVCAVFWLLR